MLSGLIVFFGLSNIKGYHFFVRAWVNLFKITKNKPIQAKCKKKNRRKESENRPVCHDGDERIFWRHVTACNHSFAAWRPRGQSPGGIANRNLRVWVLAIVKYIPLREWEFVCIMSRSGDNWMTRAACRGGAPQAPYDKRKLRNCFQTRPMQAFPKSKHLLRSEVSWCNQTRVDIELHRSTCSASRISTQKGTTSFRGQSSRRR